MPSIDQKVKLAELNDAEYRLKKMLEIAHLEYRTTYSPKEVSQLLGTSMNSIYRMIGSGQLQAIYPRSRLRIDYGSLLTFIKEVKSEL